MLTAAANATLRILFFRAGPEDFPYDPANKLVFGCIGFAVLPYLLLLGVIGGEAAHLGGVLLQAAFNVGLLALITLMTLRGAGLMNRFQQTFNALLCTTSLLTLAALPALQKLLPVIEQWGELMKVDPTIAQHPERLPPLPGGAALLFVTVGLWQLALTGFVFYRAAGARSLVIVAGFLAVNLILMAMLGGAG